MTTRFLQPVSGATLYEQLRALGQRAFAESHYEVAYHAIIAAVHCADDLRDMDRLTETAELLEQCQARIDAHAPEHPLCTRRARLRGNEALYTSGARTARFMIDGVRLEQLRSKMRLHRAGGDLPEPGAP